MLIDSVIEWAQKEDAIRSIILVGSRATKTYDELSDYDLSLFSSTSVPYLQSDAWLSSFKPVWVCVHEKIDRDSKTIPTRLVIFEGGIKVDFAFFDIEDLQKLSISSPLPDEYNRGYRVLLDKDEVTSSMPTPTYKEGAADKPMKEEFLRISSEFWFEVYHVAKYLKRQDLWSAKFRIGKFLLTMIEWNEEAKRN